MQRCAYHASFDRRVVLIALAPVLELAAQFQHEMPELCELCLRGCPNGIENIYAMRNIFIDVYTEYKKPRSTAIINYMLVQQCASRIRQ